MAHKPNQYKEALQAARPTVASETESLRKALAAAERAMTAGAWVSTKATDFEHGLGHHKTTLANAATHSLDEVDDKIHSEPDEVPEDDWRAEWYRLSRMVY
ncbi:MAG: hypothetical protein QM638_10425 [Nocardioides sp.]|uniref:hypothetical protein n=1 Tax=Nocardioides sp. TaxID=35761 RepID=UPI0039E41259